MYVKCPRELCNEHYVDECDEHIVEGITYHNCRELISNLLKHSLESGHKHETGSAYSITPQISMEANRKEKLSLLLKQLRPTHNIRDKSVPLKLFN